MSRGRAALHSGVVLTPPLRRHHRAAGGAELCLAGIEAPDDPIHIRDELTAQTRDIGLASLLILLRPPILPGPLLAKTLLPETLLPEPLRTRGAGENDCR